MLFLHTACGGGEPETDASPQHLDGAASLDAPATDSARRDASMADGELDGGTDAATMMPEPDGASVADGGSVRDAVGPPPPLADAAACATFACLPGAVEATTEGCAAGELRTRACAGDCTWGAFGDCAAASHDFDGDGAPYELDCDDADPYVRPGLSRPCGEFACGSTSGPDGVPQIDYRTGTATCLGPDWAACERPADCPEPTGGALCDLDPFAFEQRECAQSRWACDPFPPSQVRTCGLGLGGAVWTGWDPSCPPAGGSAVPPGCAMPSAMPCGACGEGTAYGFCDALCELRTSDCTGAGCTPGTTRRVRGGCDPGQYREEGCDATCVPGDPGPCVAAEPRVDVVLLVDVTGSHRALVADNATRIVDALVRPLLAHADVRVGVAWFADFPVGFYGDPGDRPFGGSLAPTSDVEAVAHALASLPELAGGDLPESGIEALDVLAGGTPHPLSRPFVCTPGAIAGGCWRAGAQRVVVMMTDVAQHGVPHPALGGAPVDPYGADVAPAPPTWSATLARLRDAQLAFFALVPRDAGYGTPEYEPAPQMKLVAAQLGEEPSASVVAYPSSAPDLGDALRDVATRVSDHVVLLP